MDVQVFLAASATVTKFVDFIRNLLDKSGRAPGWVWNVVAGAAGCAIAYQGGLNLLPAQQYGQILTGLAIGAGASGFHEIFDLFSSKAKEAKSVSVAPIDSPSKTSEEI